MSVRLEACWCEREEPARQHAGRWHELLRKLGAIDPSLQRWQLDDGRRPTALMSVDDCEQALGLGRVRWQLGPHARTSYQAHASAAGALGPAAELVLTVGIGKLGVGPVFAPERLVLTLAESFELAREVPVLVALMRAVVEAFTPDFAFAGVDDRPVSPLSLASAGVPPVGWLTYLSLAYPALPALTSPVVVTPVGALGAIVAASPSKLSAGSAEQRRAIAGVEAALVQAKVLIDAPSMLARRGAAP